METRLSKKRKEAEQTAESSREEQRESIPATAAKPAGSNEAEESSIGSPRGATNLELPAAEETALPLVLGDDDRGKQGRAPLSPAAERKRRSRTAEKMEEENRKRRAVRSSRPPPGC